MFGGLLQAKGIHRMSSQRTEITNEMSLSSIGGPFPVRNATIAHDIEAKPLVSLYHTGMSALIEYDTAIKRPTYLAELVQATLSLIDSLDPPLDLVISVEDSILEGHQIRIMLDHTSPLG